jgi:hypothetical protein
LESKKLKADFPQALDQISQENLAKLTLTKTIFIVYGTSN